MSNLFWKNFNLCFSKLKCLPLIQSRPPPQPNQDDHDSPSPTSPTATSIIIKNFNSVYDLTSDSTASRSLTHSTTADFFSSSDDSDDTDSPPDFATIFASQRLFCSSPGRSNSIFESLDTRQDPDNSLAITGSVTVPKYSVDPYIDFRRSMQEMVEARNLMDVTSEWEYLHELLLCYLTLNPKHTHKYIIRAFSDLVISILSSSSSAANHCREPKNRRQRYISRQLQV
ncbi:hypothetical protein FH972_015654 [Carpinus fangiana]|uniref:Transcription repressor n=1 Tax=Carpinus fangiana TaxID=176857 RepID=A0A5N6RE03_9ROSI|nr:hypothetical protein FH972_015654 [Carpinus fangiana]